LRGSIGGSTAAVGSVTADDTVIHVGFAPFATGATDVPPGRHQGHHKRLPGVPNVEWTRASAAKFRRELENRHRHRHRRWAGRYPLGGCHVYVWHISVKLEVVVAGELAQAGAGLCVCVASRGRSHDLRPTNQLPSQLPTATQPRQGHFHLDHTTFPDFVEQVPSTPSRFARLSAHQIVLTKDD